METILNKKEREIRKFVDNLFLRIRYLPGFIEELDRYEASFDGFGHKLTCHGKTMESAVSSVRELIYGEILFSLTKKETNTENKSR